MVISASSQAGLQATNVGMFSTDYVVYFSYASTGKDIFALDFNSGNDIQLHINPRYESGCPLFDINVLVLNNLVANKWNTEERPNGFPFIANEQTSIIVTPQESAYHIVGQAASKTFTYDFFFRNGQTPSLVTKLKALSVPNTCPPASTGDIYALSIGYQIATYTIATAIYVYATAPSSGDMAIDIILGKPNDKEDLPVALKVKVFFDEDPQILLLSDVEGVLADEQTLANPITAGNSFIFNIILQKDGYELDLDGDHIASFDHVVPLPSTPGPATVWVTGVPTLDKIEVY